MLPIISRNHVLVTGGAGFIGANLVRKLLKSKYQVDLILRDTTNCWRIQDILPQVTVHESSLLEREKIHRILYKVQPSAIVHLATYSAYRNQQDVEQMVDVNIKGTLNLLLAASDIDYRILVNTGSSSEYGIKDTPMKETDLLEPISFYAATKASATFLCQVFAREHNKPIVTLRPFSVYGPYEEKRLIPTIIEAVIKGKPIKLTSGSMRRDFIYIDDLVGGYMKVIEHEDPHNISGNIFNLGTGHEYANDEVVETLFRITKRKVPIEKGAYPARIWDTSRWVADIAQANKLLKWHSQYSLEQGLTKTYEWFSDYYHI